jgi:hypothetical protein
MDIIAAKSVETTNSSITIDTEEEGRMTWRSHEVKLGLVRNTKNIMHLGFPTDLINRMNDNGHVMIYAHDERDEYLLVGVGSIADVIEEKVEIEYLVRHFNRDIHNDMPKQAPRLASSFSVERFL